MITVYTAINYKYIYLENCSIFCRLFNFTFMSIIFAIINEFNFEVIVRVVSYFDNFGVFLFLYCRGNFVFSGRMCPKGYRR